MEKKICIKCNEEKPLIDFNKNKESKDGHENTCKCCKSVYMKKYKEEKKEKIREYNRQYMIDNKEKIKNYKKDYYNKNKKISTKIKKYAGHESEYYKDYYNKNKNKIIENQKKYRTNNKEKNKEYQKKYYEKNKEKLLEYRKLYHQKNKCRIKEYWKNYNSENPHIRAWRSVLRNAVIRMKKTKTDKTINMLGYSALELREHIEKLFTPGMSWNNYGEWHIDHIKPIYLFDKKTPVSIVNNLNNLQPLWSTTRTIDGVLYEGNLNKNK